MEQKTNSEKSNSLDETNENQIERKKDKKVTFISYKNLSNENLCEPFYYNQEEFQKKKKSMRYSNLQSLMNNNGLINNLQRKKSIINFENTENKNKNLKFFNGNKMQPFLGRNNNNNYYLNRKYSSIIFNRFNKLDTTPEENPKEIVVNKLYFCTKINVLKEDKNKDIKEETKKAKRKKKSKSPNKNIKKNKSEHKPIVVKKIKINNNSTSNKKQKKNKNEEENNNKKLNKIKFNNRFKDFPTENQNANKTMNDFRKKNKFTFPSKNKNKINNSKKAKNDNINNKTFYPKLPTKFSKSQIKEEKEKEDSSSNSSSYTRKRKHNYLFYQINLKKDYKNKKLDKSNSKTITNEEILKTPLPNIKTRNKKKDKIKKELLLPKINDTINKENIKENDKENNIPNLKKRKINITPITSSQNKKINYNKNTNKTIDNSNNKNIIRKNKSTLDIKKEKNNDLSSYHIMNYSHKDVENNFIKYDIHYCNNTLCQKCQTPSINIKANLTQTNNFNIKKLPKLNLYSNSSINHNKNEIEKEKENMKTTLQLQSEYSKKIKRRFFRSLNNNDNKNNTIKKNNSTIAKKIKTVNSPKYEGAVLKMYNSSLLAIKEYFNIK